MASNIKRSRVSVDRDVGLFFTNINTRLQGKRTSNLYNYDKTNITDGPGTKEVVVPRNNKREEIVQERSRALITMMFCGIANGDLLPPMAAYKALNLHDNWTQGGPAGTKHPSSASGWFDMNLLKT